MSNPIPPSPAGSNQPSTAAETPQFSPGLEEKLRAFWEKNSKAVVLVVVAVLLVIVGRGAVAMLAAKKQDQISAAYGAASTPEQLRQFASQNEGNDLAGAAHLRLADEAYQAGNFTDALSQYEQAAKTLDDTPLAGRIRIGMAMARLQSGQVEAAKTGLKAIADDVSQLKAVRAEAAYHLAVLASESGSTEEMGQLANQITSIDPNSVWTQRALMLRTMTPAASAPVANTPAAPATSTTEPAPTDPAVPTVSFPGASGK